MNNTNSMEAPSKSRLDDFKYLLPQVSLQYPKKYSDYILVIVVIPPSLFQIASASMASCFGIFNGLDISYPAILIAQLNKTNLTTNVVAVSENEFKWFVSCGVIVMPISASVAGIVVDYVGRLNSLRLAGIISIVGCILIASANSIIFLILGRLLTSSASIWFALSFSTYVAEISSPNIRGTLLNVLSIAFTFGMFLSFFLAGYVNWSTLSFINMTVVIASCIMSIFLHESTLWLITKTRFAAAKKSLLYFNKYKKIEKENFDGMIELELQTLKELYRNRHEIKYSGLKKFKLFLQPCGYKPLLIVSGLWFFQELSGYTVLLSHLITIFKECGTSINPNNGTVYIAAAKVFTAVCNFWLLKRFYRRTLLLVSCTGMAISMLVTAFGVKLIKDGSVGYDWVPLCGLIFYFSFCGMGMLPVLHTISAELFPTCIRGTGMAFVTVIHTALEVLAIQCYYLYKNTFSLWQILLVFGLIPLLGSIYIYMFIPETHRLILAETESLYSTSPRSMTTRNATNNDSIDLLPTTI